VFLAVRVERTHSLVSPSVLEHLNTNSQKVTSNCVCASTVDTPSNVL
jgi:hypothetical protein